MKTPLIVPHTAAQREMFAQEGGLEEVLNVFSNFPKQEEVITKAIIVVGALSASCGKFCSRLALSNAA